MQKQVENSERWEKTYLKLKSLSQRNDENDKIVQDLCTSLKAFEKERQHNKEVNKNIQNINGLVEEFEHKSEVLETITKLIESQSRCGKGAVEIMLRQRVFDRICMGKTHNS
jgi:predicted patatin/cPLA2 family phospholipase